MDALFIDINGNFSDFKSRRLKYSEKTIFPFISIDSIRFNPLHATCLFQYCLKTSKNFWFSDVFRGYRKRPVACNGLGWKAFLNYFKEIVNILLSKLDHIFTNAELLTLGFYDLYHLAINRRSKEFLVHVKSSLP